MLSLMLLTSVVSVAVYKDHLFKEGLYEEGCSSCQLYDPDVKNGLNGLYEQDNYYCVWTEGRTFEAINKTEYHEVCHDFVNKQHEHFCEGGIDIENEV